MFFLNLVPMFIIIKRRLRNPQLITILIIRVQKIGEKPNKYPKKPSRIRHSRINLPHRPNKPLPSIAHKNFHNPIEIFYYRRLIRVGLAPILDIVPAY